MACTKILMQSLAKVEVANTQLPVCFVFPEHFAFARF